MRRRERRQRVAGPRRGGDQEEAPQRQGSPVLPASKQEQDAGRAESDGEQAEKGVGEGGILPGLGPICDEERGQPHHQLEGSQRSDEPRQNRSFQQASVMREVTKAMAAAGTDPSSRRSAPS